MHISDIVQELYNIGAIRFGLFTLKSGIISPFYCDMRLIVSHPRLIKMISAAFVPKLQGLSFDFICGVPYGGIPLATCLSLEKDIPMVFQRKEKKDYGTKKMIEGSYVKGQRCLLVEDVITSGASILETVELFKQEGLEVQDVFIIVDRCQGGRERLEQSGLRVHVLLSMIAIIDILLAQKKIEQEIKQQVVEFLQKHQVG